MPSAREGIDLTKNSSGDLSLTITRIDSTQIFFGCSFETKILELTKNGDFLCIVDSKVWKFHSHRFAGLKTFVIKAGDKHKNHDTLKDIINAAVEHKISRNGFFVAIGGGTVTDMTGFAANNYFRGIRYINVPTTLLGMVDAAVGGKTAVNHEYQKNMIGSFYHPSAIVYDFSLLSTLDERNYHNGFGEIIKIALLSDKNLFEKLKTVDREKITLSENLKSIIAVTVEEKLRMLGANCFERDLRRPLNLGHTIAHPVEDITGFSIMHGEAVAIGCLFSSAIALGRNKQTIDDYEKLLEIVNHFGFPPWGTLGIGLAPVLLFHSEIHTLQKQCHQ
jgi:3-dehydroquinate synthase